MCENYLDWYGKLLEDWERDGNAGDTFLSKIPIAPCYCQMMGQTLKEEIRRTLYNNPPIVGKY